MSTKLLLAAARSTNTFKFPASGSTGACTDGVRDEPHPGENTFLTTVAPRQIPPQV